MSLNIMFWQNDTLKVLLSDQVASFCYYANLIKFNTDQNVIFILSTSYLSCMFLRESKFWDQISFFL